MSATITITLPPELEQVVFAKASASGKRPEEYLLQVIQKDAALPSLRALFAEVRADIQTNGVTDEELDADIDAAVAEVRARHRV